MKQDINIFYLFTVITGSTDGIGKEYAREFASKGINIVLISRSQSKLVQVANEIGNFLTFLMILLERSQAK